MTQQLVLASMPKKEMKEEVKRVKRVKNDGRLERAQLFVGDVMWHFT